MTTAEKNLTSDTQKEIKLESPTILRTAESGCWEVYKGTWGSYLRPTFDPEANVVITDENLKHFELNENIHRIPAELWAKWVKLCFHYVDKVESCVEVSMRILRSQSDPSVYRFLVPRQKVCGASVRVDSFDEAIDLDTGEEITEYPPEGWIPVGSSHSHNTMQAFFSGVDDKYELGDPGIHVVVGSIDTKTMKYTICASVVGSGRRFSVDFNDLIDTTPIPNQSFHPKVIDYVDYSSLSAKFSSKSGLTQYPSKWKKTESKTTKNSNYHDPKYWGWENDIDDYSDPFYWSNTYTKNTKVDIWNIMDILQDFVLENDNNPKELQDLKEKLSDFVSDLDIYFTSIVP